MAITSSGQITITDLSDGNDGVGIKTTDITYANSTSGTTAPTTGWTSSVPSPVKGQYLWTKTVWTSTDTSTKTAYSVSYNSKDGTNGTDGTSGIIVSSAAPTSPKAGQLWQDISTTPQLVKKWTGTSWVIWELYAQNLKADSLSALSANLGDINGGTLKLMSNDLLINGRPKMYGLYQSKLGLISSGPTFETAGSGLISDTQMGVISVNKGEMRFIVTDYTEDLKTLQASGMSDRNNAFINFASYEGRKDTMTIGSSGDIVFKGNTLQDTQWVKMTNFAYYKVMFGRVNIRVSLTSGSSRDNIFLGTVPNNYKSPNGDMMLPAQAWSINTGLDRHVQYTTNGNLYLLNPEPNTKYVFETSYTL